MRKANHFDEIDQALKFNEEIEPTHKFFVNLSDVRGDYQKRELFQAFGVRIRNGQCHYNYEINRDNKTLFFLGGMRGSGKTTELAQYAQMLHDPDCYFVVTCNIDKDLSLDDTEFMDILILMLEKLTEKLRESNVKVDKDAASSLKKWFENRVVEINRGIKGEAGIELGVEHGKDSIFNWLLGTFATLKMGVSGSAERKQSIRSTLKNNFIDFARKFNEYVLEAARALRKKKKGQEILFIIDGLEKTWTAEVRRKIVIDEANRLQQIKANIIYTLPIELMKERQRINQFATQVLSFPYIKIAEKDGSKVEGSYQRLREFVLKRINAELFENEAIIDKAIEYSGGSPRELLRILERAYFLSDEEKGKIESPALDRALVKLGNQTAQYLTTEEWEVIEKVIENNKAGITTDYNPLIESLLEKLILMEYNDGTFKNINPVLTLSDHYRQKFDS